MLDGVDEEDEISDVEWWIRALAMTRTGNSMAAAAGLKTD